MAQLSCYNWEGKEARALCRERTGRHGCTGRGREPPSSNYPGIPPSAHFKGTKPNCKSVCVTPVEKSKGHSKRALSTRHQQPVGAGGNFQTGSWRRRSPGWEDSAKKGGHSRPPRCSHTESWAPQSTASSKASEGTRPRQGHLGPSTFPTEM